jgi:hypothetical protein
MKLRKFAVRRVTKRPLDDRERTHIPEVKTEETAPVSFDEAAKLAEWRKSMRAEVKALITGGAGE